MPWYQLDDANDPKLDELAKQYSLHPLHIEDARSAGRGRQGRHPPQLHLRRLQTRPPHPRPR